MSQNESSRQPRRRRDGGFTLLEIMVVLAIIGLLFGSVGVVVVKRFGGAQVKTAKIRVGEVSSATTQFMMDNSNNCPRGVEDLIAQKYLKKGFDKDPWGQKFVFVCPGTNDTDSADISSNGPDKQPGTADDIRSWDQ